MRAIKPLLPILGKPVIAHCLAALQKARVDDISLVLAPANKAVAESAKGFSLRVVYNQRPELGMTESVRIGLKAVPSLCSGILICLADQPLVEHETISRLLLLHKCTPNQICIPMFKGRQGHPVLFPRRLMAELTPGITMRDLIKIHPGSIIRLPVDDEGVLLDMDTPEDYEYLCRRAESRHLVRKALLTGQPLNRRPAPNGRRSGHQRDAAFHSQPLS